MNNKLKSSVSLLFMISLIIITSYFIFKDQSLPTLLQTLKDVNLFYIILGLCMMFIFVGCEAMNTFSIMRALGQKISYIKCLGFAFIGFYFSSITPSSSGGQPAQMFYMNKANINLSYSSLNLLIITVVYQMVLMFSVTINLLLTIGILLAMFSKKFIYQLIYLVTKWLGAIRIIKDVPATRFKLESLVKEYTIGADYLKTRPLLLLRVVFTTTIQLTSTYLVPYFVYKAFHLNDFTLLQIISLQSLVSLAVSSIPLPGAVGASENAFMSAFKLFFASNLIVPAMLLCRGISFYAFLIISGIISMIVHFLLTKEQSTTPPSKSMISI